LPTSTEKPVLIYTKSQNQCSQVTYASSYATDFVPCCFPNNDLGTKLDLLLMIDGSHLAITFLIIN